MTLQATGVEVTPSNNQLRWSRMTGPGFIMGGAGIVAIMLLESLAGFGIWRVDAFFFGPGRYIVAALAGLFLVIGLVSLFVRHVDSVGAIGNLGIFVSALAAVLITATSVAILLDLANALSALLVSFFVLLPAGMLLFGYATIRTRALPRWNALPLLIGATTIVTVPVMAEMVTLFPLGTVSYLLSGLGWMLLGVVLWDESSDQPIATPSTSN